MKRLSSASHVARNDCGNRLSTRLGRTSAARASSQPCIIAVLRYSSVAASKCIASRALPQSRNRQERIPHNLETMPRFDPPPMERIFCRFAQGYRFERHYILGHAKYKVRATLAAAVMISMALGHVRNGRQQQMRSLVRPVPVLNTG